MHHRLAFFLTLDRMGGCDIDTAMSTALERDDNGQRVTQRSILYQQNSKGFESKDRAL
jgi:hypothetical protein